MHVKCLLRRPMCVFTFLPENVWAQFLPKLLPALRSHYIVASSDATAAFGLHSPVFFDTNRTLWQPPPSFPTAATRFGNFHLCFRQHLLYVLGQRPPMGNIHLRFRRQLHASTFIFNGCCDDSSRKVASGDLSSPCCKNALQSGLGLSSTHCGNFLGQDLNPRILLKTCAQA